MRLLQLLREAGIPFAPGNDPEINDIVSDSRRAHPGSLFVAIRGLHADGHAYLDEAARAGAVAAVVADDWSGEASLPLARAADTRAALACLWDAFLDHPAAGMRLIAVTGTNGKTSVSWMLRAIFSAALCRTGLIGTVSCWSGERRLASENEDPLANMTTPDPAELYRMLAEMRNDGVEVVILEASSHALALRKLAPLHFAAGIFTNLTPEHLDFHGTMQDYLAAKLLLFPACDVAIVNRDDPHWTAVAGAGARRVFTCSQRGGGDYRALEIESRGIDGIAYLLDAHRARFRVQSPIPGRFTVENSLLASACALELGVSPLAVQDALTRLRGVAGRLERVSLGAMPFAVFIDYAHTPDALENLLRTARAFRRNRERIVLLFGCGGDRDPMKRKPMGRIATEMADFVIITTDNARSEPPRDIIADILRGVDREKPYIVIERRADAIAYAIRTARPGDIILLAGKGHERYEIDAQGRHPFDERRVVAEAVQRYWGEAPRQS